METLKQTLTKYKVVIALVLVIVVGVLGYNIYSAGTPQDDGALIRSNNLSVVNSEIGHEIVSTLNRLKGINIDPEFFEEQSFTRLVDFSVEIEEQPVGKINPFRNESDTSVDTEVAGSEIFDQVIEEQTGPQASVPTPLEFE